LRESNPQVPHPLSLLKLPIASQMLQLPQWQGIEDQWRPGISHRPLHGRLPHPTSFSLLQGIWPGAYILHVNWANKFASCRIHRQPLFVLYSPKMAAAQRAIPSHLRDGATPNGEAASKRNHHGKSQSHVVSSISLRSEAQRSGICLGAAVAPLACYPCGRLSMGSSPFRRAFPGFGRLALSYPGTGSFPT